MKEILYRLPSSPSFAKLFSLLAFAAASLYYPSVSFAVVYCKDNSPLTPCTRFTGTTCPPSTKPAYTVKCSTTGGTTGTGSEWQALIRIGDLGIGIKSIEVPDPLPPPPDFFIKTDSVCGPGFIDFSQDVAGGQAVDCKYTPDSGPTAGVKQDAKCLFDNLACRCNKIDRKRVV